ncbi:hypothetical protein BJI47_07300 [Rhodococcus sp. 1168]|nr:hypothetical protein BJI47_07300 [Rhodococcus sp. 1168]
MDTGCDRRLTDDNSVDPNVLCEQIPTRTLPSPTVNYPIGQGGVLLGRTGHVKIDRRETRLLN